MPEKTNRAILELCREILNQNAHGLITDWEAICAISLRASQALTPADEPNQYDGEPTADYVNQDR